MKSFKLLNSVFNFSAERYLRSAGNLFVENGDYRQALVLVNKALDLHRGNPRAWLLKGDILFSLGRNPESLRAFNQAIKLDADFAEAYVSKAGVLDVLEQADAALTHCNIALTLITRRNDYLLPGVYDQKISLLLHLQKYRQARAVLREAASRLTAEDHQALVWEYGTLLKSCFNAVSSSETRRDLVVVTS